MLVVSAQLIDDFMGESIQSKLCIVFLHQNSSMQLTATATATAGFKMFLNHMRAGNRDHQSSPPVWICLVAAL
jgi:hypothetical protein